MLLKNVNMKKVIYLLLLFVVCSCMGEQESNKSQVTFKSNIKVIERYLKGETIKGTGLDDSVTFFEELTKIESNIFEGIDKLSDPTEKNLQDWKDWYKINKTKLYWDEKEQMIKIKE